MVFLIELNLIIGIQKVYILISMINILFINNREKAKIDQWQFIKLSLMGEIFSLR
jgi:hypothetical protein